MSAGNTRSFASEGELLVRDSKVEILNDLRLVGIARGEQEYFDPAGIPTATEGVKSNALMRCCKDIGIASELWYATWHYFLFGTISETHLNSRDPRFIREFKAKYCMEVFAENVTTKKKLVSSFWQLLPGLHLRRKKLWRRKDSPKFDYPWKE